MTTTSSSYERAGLRLFQNHRMHVFERNVYLSCLFSSLHLISIIGPLLMASTTTHGYIAQERAAVFNAEPTTNNWTITYSHNSTAVLRSTRRKHLIQARTKKTQVAVAAWNAQTAPLERLGKNAVTATGGFTLRRPGSWKHSGLAFW